MVNKKFNKGFKLENYDTHFSLCTQKWFLIIVVILTLLLIIKKSNRFQNINNLTVERLLLFFKKDSSCERVYFLSLLFFVEVF